MKIEQLRNRARKGIEPERIEDSPLLPKKVFIGMDPGIGDSVKFFILKNRNKNAPNSTVAISQFERMIEVDWNKT